MSLDPRITPARPDLAAKHLEGKVTAARFAEGEEREVIDAQAPVRAEPAPDAPLVTEALLGDYSAHCEFFLASIAALNLSRWNFSWSK